MADEDSLFSRFRLWINEGVGKWITVAVVLALLVVAVWAGVRTLTRKGTPAARRAARRGLTRPYVCKACGATGTMLVPFGGTWPRECPKCHKKEAVEGMRCPKCGAIVERKPPGQTVRCPQCGYTWRVPAPPPGAFAPKLD